MNAASFRRFRERMNRKVRVSFFDDDTLKENRRYVLQPKTMWAAGILAVLLIVAATASAIVFTPFIRQQIPGYLNPEYEVKQTEVLQKLKALDQVIVERDSMLTLLKNISQGMGNPTNLQQQEVKPTPTSSPVTPSTSKSNNTPATAVVVSKEKSTEMPVLYLPVEGKVRRPFNQAAGHFGVDIAAKEKASVKSATTGTVVVAEYSDRNGYVIAIAGAGNIVTFYKHNSQLLKKTGDHVRAGEAIAIIGNSGENTNGPHLHFEVWKGGIAINPVDYLAAWR